MLIAWCGSPISGTTGSPIFRSSPPSFRRGHRDRPIPREHVVPPGASLRPPMTTEFPLLHHQQPDGIVAYREGRAVSAAAFLADAAALAAMLPSRRHVVNLCPDRYRFAVGLT